MERDLLERVNPIYKNEQEYIKHLAFAKVPYAEKLYEQLEYNEIIGDPGVKTFENGNDVLEKIVRIADEARYNMTNEMIRGYEFTNVIELPCGYTPRGIMLAEEDYKYVGLDLPIVISDISSAARTICDNHAHRASYEAMDATNFGSITHAIENVNGKVTIVSEIMLSYLTDSELISVCDNIYKLLSNRGGCWITMDIGCRDLYRNTCIALTGNDEAYREMADHFRSTSNIDLYDNCLYRDGLKGAEDFLTFRGFEIEKVNVSEVYPELNTIKDIPGMDEKLKEAFHDMDYWTLTVARRRGSRVINTESRGSTVEKKTGNGFLYLSLTGRIDTITAPEMLRAYEETAAEGPIEKITIDCKELEYISSAGLRVLLIMVKALKDKNGMILKNVSDQVLDILETTGFNDLITNISRA
ncbi:MAG: STAS domain-containing protein [Lachnospiraceae bacterium]|nr:STAS domain-containing protein [Lachnospiraceae bacterium]